MKIYDISQEILNCDVYPGDPKPNLVFEKETSKGELYNLSTITMGNHNGTHIDAPLHFIDKGKSIKDIDLNKCVGYCFVINFDDIKDEETTINTLNKLQSINKEASKRLLVKQHCDISKEVAHILAENIDLIGSQTQSVGPEKAPMAVHLELLSKDVVLLEGLRLNNIKEGMYLLNAAPLNIGIAEGAPCRAILIEY